MRCARYCRTQISMPPPPLLSSVLFCAIFLRPLSEEISSRLINIHYPHLIVSAPPKTPIPQHLTTPHRSNATPRRTQHDLLLLRSPLRRDLPRPLPTPPPLLPPPRNLIGNLHLSILPLPPRPRIPSNLLRNHRCNRQFQKYVDYGKETTTEEKCDEGEYDATIRSYVF